MSGITEYPLSFLESLACTNSATERRPEGCRAAVQDTTSYEFPFRRQCRNRPAEPGALCAVHAAHAAAGLTVVEFEADHSNEAAPDDDLRSHLTDDAVTRRVLEATFYEDDGGEAALEETRLCGARLLRCRQRGRTLRYYAGGAGTVAGMLFGGTVAADQNQADANDMSMYYA
jgi:hypothetical protein